MYIIDRFEEDWAVIERPDRSTFNLPRELLPEGSREGDVVAIAVAKDASATADRRAQLQARMANFFDK